jgi:hypothetical protein
MIAGLLAKIATPFIVGFLLIATIVLGFSTVVQSIRLNGFSILGWEISEGYQPQALRLARENGKLIANNLVLSNGLDKCNIGVASLETARKTFQAEAQKLVDERLRLQQEYAALAKRVGAIKPTDAKCPTVDNIFNTGFGK